MWVSSVRRREPEPRYSLSDYAILVECRCKPEKWAARKTILCAVCITCVLWSGIVFAASLLF
jgi:hypothetical protein